jgi:hypothetical protein
MLILIWEDGNPVHVTEIVTLLMDSSLAESTRKLYNKLWSELTNFCMVQLHEQDSHPPISISTLSLFLTYLLDKGYAPSTMITYNSAISYVHKLNGLIDPGNSVFIVNEESTN